MPRACFLLDAWDCYCYPGSLLAPCKFQNCFPSSMKDAVGNFIGNALNPCMVWGEYDNFDNVGFASTGTSDVFPFPNVSL